MPKARTLPTMGQPQPGRPIAPAQAATQADGPRTLIGALLVPIEQIAPDPDQPRHDMGGDRLADLAASLKEYGVLQPLLVREAGLLDDGRTRYMIVAGGRRYAAAQQAGLVRLPIVVRESEGATLRVTQLIENVQRQDLAPLEEARAVQELMDADGLTAAALATRLHISPQKVRDRVLLLSDQVMADAVQRGQITPTTARDVLRMADETQVPLRVSIAEGDRIDGAAIQTARARAAASGVVNPRSKGGGRSVRAHPPKDAGTPAQEHTAYVPDPVQGLYEAFKGWEAQVSHLAPHDLQRLVGLIRDDMQSFIASVTEMTSNERDGAIEAVRTGDTL